MNALETLDITSDDLETGGTAYSCQEKSQLPSYEPVILELKNQQTEMHLPGQIQENCSGPLTRNELSNNRKAMASNNEHSNGGDVKVDLTEQKQLYGKCVNMFRVIALLFGVRVNYAWKPQKYFLFYLTMFFQFFTFFSVFYTVYVHYVNGDYLRILEPLSILGIVVSCALKLYVSIINWQQILALIFAKRKYFRLNVFGRQADILELSLRKTWIFIKVFIVGNAMCLSVFFIAPITVYIRTSELTPLLPIMVIFCDQTQTSGFMVTTTLHMILGCYASAGAIFYGSIIIFCFRTYILQAELIAEDLKVLDNMWNAMNNVSVDYNRSFLKNICKKCQDMNNFLKIIKFVFETQFSIYFCFNYFSQIIFLYDITQNGWIGGYGPCFMSFLEMMFYCYMGTQLSTVDDKLCYSIYHSNWYKYDLESQQMVTTLLHEAQQAKDIQLIPIGQLNLMTGVVIVKSIYSYYTVMTELF